MLNKGGKGLTLEDICPLPHLPHQMEAQDSKMNHKTPSCYLSVGLAWNVASQQILRRSATHS